MGVITCGGVRRLKNCTVSHGNNLCLWTKFVDKDMLHWLNKNGLPTNRNGRSRFEPRSLSSRINKLSYIGENVSLQIVGHVPP